MQYDDISMLPPKYQEQVRRKLAERERRLPADTIYNSVPREKSGQDKPHKETRKKYGNREQTIDGVRFDSQKEARRFLELREQLRRGEISDLKLQVNFTLQEGYTTPEGTRVRPIVYKADFAYRRPGAGDARLYIVEDVKSKATKTRVYLLKKKLMREKYGIEIQEI